MTENFSPDPAPVGSPKGEMGPIAWGKVKRGALFAVGGATIGGTMGAALVNIAIEQGWLAERLQQANTLAAIICVANVVCSVALNIWHQYQREINPPTQQHAGRQ